MKEIVLGPNEIVFTKGSLDSNLYFVIRGEIEYFGTKTINEAQNL